MALCHARESINVIYGESLGSHVIILTSRGSADWGQPFGVQTCLCEQAPKNLWIAEVQVRFCGWQYSRCDVLSHVCRKVVTLHGSTGNGQLKALHEEFSGFCLIQFPWLILIPILFAVINCSSVYNSFQWFLWALLGNYWHWGWSLETPELRIGVRSEGDLVDYSLTLQPHTCILHVYITTS